MLLVAFIILNAVSLQVIQVNNTEPCFLNYTAGAEMWQNCGMGDDFMATMLLGWEYSTGGFFSMAIVGIFSLMTYIKYHKAVYPLMIGIMFLPVSFFLFPTEFIMFAALFTIALIGILLWYIFVRQTKEFG